MCVGGGGGGGAGKDLSDNNNIYLGSEEKLKLINLDNRVTVQNANLDLGPRSRSEN